MKSISKVDSQKKIHVIDLSQFFEEDEKMSEFDTVA